MSRLSLEDAVKRLEEEGYQRQGKSYKFVKDKDKLEFGTGRELVKFVRDQKRPFDEAEAMKELELMEKRFEEIKDDNRQWKERDRLKKEIDEKRIEIKAKGKVLTANRVRQVLKDAGFKVVKSQTTRVKGWHEYSGDFTATISWRYPDAINVEVHCGLMAKDEAYERKMGDMIKVLTESGYEVVAVYNHSFLVNRILK